ncbi:hypothetical protein GCM10011586_23430 [Silvibacterium dinghuense]|nr:hypothetical protein GCM10011586_23430 [Silvibacterium dinghuense]
MPVYILFLLSAYWPMPNFCLRLTPLLLAVIPFAAGCHSQSDAIAVIPRTTATPLWEPMHQGIVETARQDKISVYWNAPPNEAYVEQQMELYATLQRRHYRGFILSPDETLAARTAVQETIERGVPVVIVDDELGPPPSPRLSYVRNDEAAGTMLAAQTISRLLHGKGSIAIIGIIPRSEASLTREDAFEKALTQVAPSIHISIRRFGDTFITHQQQIAQEVLTGSEPVDAIVALSGIATRGAYYAKLASEPRSKIAIVGFDQDLLMPLETGDVDAIIAQDTRTIGRIAMRNLDAEIHQETVPGITLVSPILLTRDNVQAPSNQPLFSYSIFRWSGS